MLELRLRDVTGLSPAVLLLLGSMVQSAGAAPKNVLILSEGPIMPYAAALRESLVAELRPDSSEPLNVYEELIDRVRFDSPEYDRQLVALYAAKYVKPAPDLVIAITEPALDFALRHRQELFPASALLFGAVDEQQIRNRDLGPHTTGMFNHIDAQTTVRLALGLHPGIRQVVVVAGASRFDHGNIEAVQEDLQALESQAAFTYIKDRSLNDVVGIVGALGSDAIVLFVGMLADADGVARSGPEVLTALRKVASVPIYGMSKNFLGAGIVGGVLLDQPNHGTELGRRARRILDGVQPDDLPRIRTTNLVAFDWRELARFGIDAEKLPAGATIVNRDPGVWDLYKRPILITGTVLAGQSLLIGGLLVQARRRKRAELAVQNLSGRLLSAQEEERRRIARELHDNVSQRMAVLGIRISQSTSAAGAPEAIRAMREIGQLAGEISTDIHNLSHQLHSSKLELLGLVDALTEHCHELRAQEVEVTCRCENVPRTLPRDVEICIFRVVQEGLNNVVKHSDARAARVTLTRQHDVLVLAVADEGRGFSPTEGAARNGVGLASMRERLRLLDGALTLESKPGQGTTITAYVPIPRRAEKAIAGVATQVM